MMTREEVENRILDPSKENAALRRPRRSITHSFTIPIFEMNMSPSGDT